MPIAQRESGCIPPPTPTRGCTHVGPLNQGLLPKGFITVCTWHWTSPTSSPSVITASVTSASESKSGAQATTPILSDPLLIKCTSKPVTVIRHDALPREHCNYNF